MTPPHSVNTLRQHRPILLACEAIGWFHIVGKARMEFLRKHGGENVDYDYKQWHDQETPPFDWDVILGWVKSFPGSQIHQIAWPNSVREFVEKHPENSPGMLGLLQAGHGVASGIEKNLPTRASGYLAQPLIHIWLSSPFGHPRRNLFADLPEVLRDGGWPRLVGEIRRVLEELRNLAGQNAQAVARWVEWRERAIGQTSFIRQAFLSTVAETRLPNNDVTLWDQSYIAAALFKSAVAGALLDPAFPWNRRIKRDTQWRLLTVAIGTDHYEARAVRIGDWTGMQGKLEEFFARVSEIVEVDLAVGSLLYRDSSMAVFSFPGERSSGGATSQVNGLAQWLEGEVDNVAQGLGFEIPPLVRMYGPTRSLVPIVLERREAQKKIAVPIHKRWQIDSGSGSGHVCPVCQVRLNDDPTNKGKPCQVCRNRRHHRRDNWLIGCLGRDTIWFEEVVDRNGRAALVTLSMDLEPWLSGERVDSLRAQAVSEWRRFNPALPSRTSNPGSGVSEIPNPVDPAQPFESLQRYIRSKLSQFDQEDPVLQSLQEGYKNEKDWPPFFQKVVEDRSEAPSWDKLNNDQRAIWLVHQFFRKLPSPGRVYRFWRESQAFFEDLLREFRQIAARSENPWRVRRLLLLPQSGGNWQDGLLYDGRWRGIQFSLIYVRALGGFLTASNLARLLQPEEKGNALQGQRILLEEEDTFSRPQSLVVAQVQEVSGAYAHLSVYHPLILLELSPLRFRVIVPLEVASECVDLALARWKEVFARVWDRLPLHAGIVAFDRTIPFQAVVEAARNLEDRLAGSQEERWTVAQSERHPGVVALTFRRPDGRMTTRIVPVRMPDGRDDVFYPYVRVEDQTLRHPLDFRHPSGVVYRHAADLRLGDGVAVVPAHIGFLYMESASARFEEGDLLYTEDWEAMRQIWKLAARVTPSQTALQRLRSALARLDQGWRDFRSQASIDLWRDTLRALIAEHLELETMNAALEALTEAALQGLLQRALEWHITALRQSA